MNIISFILPCLLSYEQVRSSPIRNSANWREEAKLTVTSVPSGESKKDSSKTNVAKSHVLRLKEYEGHFQIPDLSRPMCTSWEL